MTSGHEQPLLRGRVPNASPRTTHFEKHRQRRVNYNPLTGK